MDLCTASSGSTFPNHYTWDYVMITDILVKNFRSTIITLADRDFSREFNKNLHNYNYLVFFGYGDTKDSILVGFSNIGTKYEEISIRDIDGTIVDNQRTRWYFGSSLAPHIFNQRIVIKCSEIEPIPVPSVSWDIVRNAKVLESGDIRELSDATFEYMQVDEAPWSASEECENYLSTATNIRLDVIYRNSYKSLSRETNRSTLVYYHDELVGVLSLKGHTGCGILTVLSFDRPKMSAMFDEIIERANLSQYLPPIPMVDIDLSNDCDEYFAVPGVTKMKEDGDEY